MHLRISATLGRVVKHILAILILLALLLLTMTRNVAPDPYVYDEADYMYAASLGFAANFTDTPTLPSADFLRIGLARGTDAAQRQALSQQIRARDDVVFYRHWHGPLYLYALIPVSRLGLTERQTRMAMLAIPALTLAVIYCGCLWLIPGRSGTFAALAAGVLFLSSNAVVASTELAPHQLFALWSVGFLFLLSKFVVTGRSACWYGAVVAAGLAFCTLEVAFVLLGTLVICGYLERGRPRAGWRMAGRSLALFVAVVVVVWPAALFKLSFVKGYLFMAYLGLFRKAAWGNEGIWEVWGRRVLDSPLEWVAIAASLFLCFRWRGNSGHRAYPMLVYAALMLAATARVVSSATRYSLLFVPALDIFAALTLGPVLALSRAWYGVAALFCGFLGADEYREFIRNRSPDPRPPAVLNYIRENRLEESTLLVPQEDLPMIHYYFPRAHLRGYYDLKPEPTGNTRILNRGYPLRIESQR